MSESELDKLLKSGGSRRPVIKARQSDRGKTRTVLWWMLGISFFLMMIPPYIGALLFVPTLIACFFNDNRQWFG